MDAKKPAFPVTHPSEDGPWTEHEDLGIQKRCRLYVRIADTLIAELNKEAK